MTANKADYEPTVIEPAKRSAHPISEQEIETALSYMRKAKKPYIFVGGGAVISGASEELKKFVFKDIGVKKTLLNTIILK